MANNFSSNFTRKLMEKVIPAFESSRVLSKNVNTQLFQGKFNGGTGTQIDVQRPTDYQSVRTSAGDISSSKRDIITGKATATVQDYITVAVDYDEADEALKMGNNKSRFWDDIARRIVTDLEVDFADFMMKNAGLKAGVNANAVDTWEDIAEWDAFMNAVGVPAGGRNAAVNPFIQSALASNQRSLGAGGAAGGLVKSAVEKATISENFAGFDRDWETAA